MNISRWFVIGTVAIALGLVACQSDVTAVTNLHLTPQGATIAQKVDTVGGCVVATDFVARGLPTNSVASVLPGGGVLDITTVRRFSPQACANVPPVVWTSSNVNSAKVSPFDSVTGRVVGGVVGVSDICGNSAWSSTVSIKLCVTLPVGNITPGSCTISNPVVTPPSSSMLQGSTMQLSVSVPTSPAGCASSAVTWSVTSGPGTINTTTGLLTANTGATGTIAVVAKSVVDTTKTGGANITVSAATITGFTMTPKPMPLVQGNSQTPGISIGLSDGTTLSGAGAVGKFNCVSRNTSIATINSSTCATTAVAVGSTYVVGTTVGTPTFTDSVLVTVSSGVQVFINPPTLLMHTGAGCPNTSPLNVTVLGSTAGVMWSATTHGAASVDNTGLVTRLAVGTDTITADVGGVKAFAVITVDNQPCTGGITLSMTPAADSGLVGTFGVINPVVSPVGTAIQFTSSDPTRVDVMPRDSTFATASNGWPAGLHKAGEVHYKFAGTSQICVYAKLNPAVTFCGLFKAK